MNRFAVAWLSSGLLLAAIALTKALWVAMKSRRPVRRSQWRDDCETLLVAAMYGNPPGGWSDPQRRKEFSDEVSDIERRMRS